MHSIVKSKCTKQLSLYSKYSVRKYQIELLLELSIYGHGHNFEYTVVIFEKHKRFYCIISNKNKSGLLIYLVKKVIKIKFK
jgi:hypothetical protein